MYFVHKQIQWFTIYSSRNPRPTEGDHCENPSTRLTVELPEYSSILGSPRTKDHDHSLGSFNSVTNINRTRNRTGDIMATCQVLLSITGKEGHHSEPITFYLADLSQEDLILATDWLRLHNPDINWQTDQITLS